MYEFSSTNGSIAQSSQVWDRTPLQVFAHILTPFSYSVLAEISRRAWFRYYERLGLTLPFSPRNLMRQYQGRAYLNIKWVCERDVEFANLPPLIFKVNGKPFPLATPAKTNLISNFRNSLNERRISTLLNSLVDEMDAMTARAKDWYERVQTFRWTQAEILQIMEEIERYGVEPLMAFYAARHSLGRIYNTLLAASPGGAGERLMEINQSLAGLQGLVEGALADEIVALAALARQEPAIRTWLQGDRFDDWQTRWADDEFGRQLQQLMAAYGHWTLGTGELANPRWIEQPRFLFKSILACVDQNSERAAHSLSTSAAQELISHGPGSNRKTIGQQMAQIRQLTVLQSRALHAFGYILAGTRIWGLAAGVEATQDRRLDAVDDCFFFELEELKRMMTGEWNVANRKEIQATAAQRQAAYREWHQARPGDVLFDDAEAFSVHHGLPAAAGEATGPFRRQREVRPGLCAGAIVGAQQLDSGWAPVLPIAGGLVAEAGSPMDPIAAAARLWQTPAVVALGSKYDKLADDVQTRLNGTGALVEQ